MPSAVPQVTLPLVRLVASTTTEEYSIIEVTGATSGTGVRDLVYAKLQVPADVRHRYFIYPSEIGSYALGGALNDGELFALCLERGDPTGSLKFFVSTHPNRRPIHIIPGYSSERAAQSAAKR